MHVICRGYRIPPAWRLDFPRGVRGA